MEQFIGQIRTYGFNFPPRGMALCNGQVMQISQNAALYSLLGTQFGGDGQTTYALPDLRGRTPVGAGQSTGSHYTQGQIGGLEYVTLTVNEIGHTHSVMVNAAPADNGSPTGNLLANADKPPNNDPVSAYTAANNLTTIGEGAIGYAGGGQPHENEQPSLVISFAIALFGIFPSRN